LFLTILIKDPESTKDRQKVIEYYNKAHSHIEQEIRKFAKLWTVSHTIGTNVLSITANWPREKTSSLVNRILKIRGVGGLLTFPNYIGELHDAMEMHDFFKVVAFSSTLLESYGKQILIKHFGDKNKDRDHDRIYNLDFNATAIMLYSSGIIDKPLFDEIDYVRRERNKFIHRASHPNLITILTMERVKTMEDLAHNAIH
jgi:hypothetical protein